MNFAIFCIIALSATIQAGPLPKLRHRLPRWARARLPRLRPIKLVQTSEEAFHVPEARRFDTIAIDANDGNNNFAISFKGDLRSLAKNSISDNMRSVFGKNDAIHLTKGKKKNNILLNIVEQLVEDEKQKQDGRDIMEVSLGLKRGLRRQGGLPPKLTYDFNELVD
ncbi:uncharacterized protein LOC125239918 [Leguminivora glycinivorella]|uniref:uncharacterized protein LOC125239918 n=1 Tax=Leguminivora glycinivorella TaxID=1035111 RepID=UPI00200D9FF3|nr:uncharacterized protein LOC125239918 [Leguminivora glycinivorella]